MFLLRGEDVMTQSAVLSILASFPYLLSPLCYIVVIWLTGVVSLVSGEVRSELGHLVPKLEA